MGDEFKTGNEELDAKVESYRRIDQNTVEIHLKDGSVMTVDNNGDRIVGTVDRPFDLDMRIDQANVGLSRPDAAPVGLTEDAPGAKTAVDLESLENTQKWLRERADYLGRLYYAMPELLAKIDGPASKGAPTLGGHKGAMAIHTKHTALYTSFREGLKQTIEQLYDTADALGKIKENYAAAEERNALTAQQWQSIFTEAAKKQHQI
ncbi:hypothetical protein O7635_08935 [Asanoa sp. WMMD1127]|uniref:hypothetical protein n=1 Tax=Asanoa sp. WMMD1127 TaxID=3016107 RepID=UPI00241779F9|nr:hypothetical protein [Asanoa sp. WMMD1127]MDG4821977.1 hypothetical protein [Asanoa sp. WMMD1127]